MRRCCGVLQFVVNLPLPTLAATSSLSGFRFSPSPAVTFPVSILSSIHRSSRELSRLGWMYGAVAAMDMRLGYSGLVVRGSSPGCPRLPSPPSLSLSPLLIPCALTSPPPFLARGQGASWRMTFADMKENLLHRLLRPNAI